MDPQILNAAKFVLGWAANIGAGRIVSSFAGSVPRQNIIDKVCVPIGGFALSSVVGVVAQKHMHEQLDLVADIVDKTSEYQKKATIHEVK